MDVVGDVALLTRADCAAQVLKLATLLFVAEKFYRQPVLRAVVVDRFSAVVLWIRRTAGVGAGERMRVDVLTVDG